MHDTGWIKLHRSMTSWEWYRDSKTKSLFLHLLLLANHQPAQWRGVCITRGQLLTSLPHLASQTGLSIQSVRTSIKRLKSTGEITDQSTNRYRMITIVNYDSYQSLEFEANQQSNSLANSQLTGKQQATNRQLTSNKNEKNEKNEKNKKESIIDIFESELSLREFNSQQIEKIREFFTQRHKIKRYKTKRGITGLLNRCDELKDILESAIEFSLDREYQTIYPPADNWNSNGVPTDEDPFEILKRMEANEKKEIN